MNLLSLRENGLLSRLTNVSVSVWVRAFLVLAGLGSPTLLLPSPIQSQVLTPFDGKTLDGFEGDTKYWSVQDGAIVAEVAQGTTLNHNTWLVVKDHQPADFELKFKFRISADSGANSGVQIRSQVKSIRDVSGYQCDIDGGETWLGRIYDEHGRALLVERGSRVAIAADGQRKTEAFAPPEKFQKLFRQVDWNDYRIVAIGERIDVYLNGTLCAQLLDQEEGQKDLEGSIAFQLHSGGPMRVEFKDIRLEILQDDTTDRLAPMNFSSRDSESDNGHNESPFAEDGTPQS